jgi:hypothetical protein
MTGPDVPRAAYRAGMAEQLPAFDLPDDPAPEQAPPAAAIEPHDPGPAPGPAAQLALQGVPEAGRPRGRAGTIPSQIWQQLLDRPGTRDRYHAKIHRRGAGDCWYWLGAISSTGHGKFKATRAGGGMLVVTAHVYGYQLAHGLIRPRPGEDPVIGHLCDEASCQNPAHWELVERRDNDLDYHARRHRSRGPLADQRGPQGRAVALRTAITTALHDGHDVDAAITTAIDAGLTDAPPLF